MRTPTMVTIEVVDRKFGDQYEAEKLPLAYIDYDEKTTSLRSPSVASDSRYPVQVRHTIYHPNSASRGGGSAGRGKDRDDR